MLGSLIYNRLYVAKLNTTKFIPILFSRMDDGGGLSEVSTECNNRVLL